MIVQIRRWAEQDKGRELGAGATVLSQSSTASFPASHSSQHSRHRKVGERGKGDVLFFPVFFLFFFSDTAVKEMRKREDKCYFIAITHSSLAQLPSLFSDSFWESSLCPISRPTFGSNTSSRCQLLSAFCPIADPYTFALRTLVPQLISLSQVRESVPVWVVGVEEGEIPKREAEQEDVFLISSCETEWRFLRNPVTPDDIVLLKHK